MAAATVFRLAFSIKTLMGWLRLGSNVTNYENNCWMALTLAKHAKKAVKPLLRPK